MSADLFVVPFQVRWRDLDGNAHVGHSVYSLFALEARFICFERMGWPLAADSPLSGVMLREEVVYRRELVLGETFTVHVLLSGLSGDCSRWQYSQEITKADGRRAATVRTDGAYFLVQERRIVAPPPEGVAVMTAWARSPDFAVIERSPASLG